MVETVQPMRVLRTVAEVRGAVAGWRKEGLTVGLVPTMGALHEGHLSLVDHCKSDCDRTLATVFVNPLQFGPNEDFERYPRTEAADIEKLEARGCDLLFSPSCNEIFPDPVSPAHDFLTTVDVRKLSNVLCAQHRPGHFQGMATEVLKFFMITLPDVAFFGEKDYQQLQVVRRMVRDLNVPLSVAAVPTVRAADGLALSSRNWYLSADERRIAPSLFRVLSETATALVEVGRPVRDLLSQARNQLLSAGFTRIDYLLLADSETLQPVGSLTGPARLLAAVWIGKTRLIDNIPVRAGSTLQGDDADA